LYSLLNFPVTKTTVLLSDINNAKFVNEVYQECNYDHLFMIYNIKQHLIYKLYGWLRLIESKILDFFDDLRMVHIEPVILG